MIRLNKKIISILKSEGFLYILFGALTTAVNYVVFILLSSVFGYSKLLTINTVAFICAVIFAFVTNKVFVFKSENWQFKPLLKELLIFVLARVFSYFFEQGGLYISHHALHLEKIFKFGIDGILISKLVLNVAVIILNWIFSKFIIFKKKG